MLSRNPMRRRVRYTGPDVTTLAKLAVRSDGRCEFPGCGHAAQDPHHRYERGAGGVGPKGPAWVNSLSNLLAACRHHNDWCSNQQPHEAWLMGWIVRGRDDPHNVPVQTIHDDLPVFLHDDGTTMPFRGCLRCRDEFSVAVRRGHFDLLLPCPDCCCPVCGTPTGGGMCAEHEAQDFLAADVEFERRADV